MANESRLVLPKPMMAKLQSLGVYCQTWVTAERQDRAKRWVLRGVESGGSAKEFGRYISFFAADGSRIEWLQKADRIGANGVHAIAISETLIGVEMARVDETYQLVISRHQLGKPKTEGKRPPVESSVLFRGVDGQLSEKLRKQGLAPAFLTRSGEVKAVPADFLEATERNRGKAVLDEKGNVRVKGTTDPWIGGIPFPQPTTAQEVLCCHALSWGRHDTLGYAITEDEVNAAGETAYSYQLYWAEVQATSRLVLDP